MEDVSLFTLRSNCDTQFPQRDEGRGQAGAANTGRDGVAVSFQSDTGNRVGRRGVGDRPPRAWPTC